MCTSLLGGLDRIRTQSRDIWEEVDRTPYVVISCALKVTNFDGFFIETNGKSAVIRLKIANMSRETEALQSWIEVRFGEQIMPKPRVLLGGFVVA